jgi:uncharacterized protein
MRFTLAELEQQAVDFDESLPPGTMDLIEDVSQVGLLHSAGRADLLREHRGPNEIVQDIRIRASLRARLQIPCARCLEPVEQALDTRFDLLFRPRGADGEGVDHAISTSETEIGYYEGDGLLLEDVLREQVLLMLPTRTLCKSDCKGICTHCGRNQNLDPCECAIAPADPRWANLQSIRSRVKSQ